MMQSCEDQNSLQLLCWLTRPHVIIQNHTNSCSLLQKFSIPLDPKVNTYAVPAQTEADIPKKARAQFPVTHMPSAHFPVVYIRSAHNNCHPKP